MKNPREFPANWDLRAQKNYRLGHDAIFLFACKKKNSIDLNGWFFFLILAEFDLTRFARCPVFFLFFFGYTTWFKRQRAEPWILEFWKRFTQTCLFRRLSKQQHRFPPHVCWWPQMMKSLLCHCTVNSLAYGRECKLKGVRFQRSTVMSRFSFLLPNMYRATQTVLSMQKEKILKRTTIRHIW